MLSRYIELEEIAGVDDSFVNPIQHATIKGMEDIESIAEQLRESWRLCDNTIPNVIELLEDNHVKVIEIEAGDEFDGLQTWIKNTSNLPVIVLNTSRLNRKIENDLRRFMSWGICYCHWRVSLKKWQKSTVIPLPVPCFFPGRQLRRNWARLEANCPFMNLVF